MRVRAISEMFRLCLLALGLLVSTEASARELRLSHQFSESDARHRAARVLAAEAKKRAPALSIKIFPNSALKIEVPKQYEAMIDGTIDMTAYPMAYASAKFPELSIVTLPGLPSNAELAALLKGSEFEEKLQRFCEEKGFRILTWWWFDGGMAGRERAAAGPRSIKGLTARSGGGNDFNTMLSAAGASIVTMPANQIHAAISAGKLDVAQNSFEFLVSYRLYEVTKFVTVGGYSTLTLFNPILISKSAWDSLQEEERLALEAAAASSDVFLEATQREAQEAAIETFAKAGVQVQPLSFEDYSDWLNIAKEGAWKSYRAISPRATDLFDSMLESFIRSGKR